MRLIDADALKKDLTRFYDNEVTAKRLIDEQPTIEQEPFINKPCVSSGVCEYDKNKVLDKIRAEIDSHCSDNRDRNDGLYIAMRVIDKYQSSLTVEEGSEV